MNKYMRFGLMSLIVGLVISSLTFFINRPTPINLACAPAPNTGWTPDGIGSVYTKNRSGWPLMYFEKVESTPQVCYLPNNAAVSVPYNGNHGQFIGYSKFKPANFAGNVLIWALLSLGLDLYLNYVFMPRRRTRRAAR
jgi:hypothetical protein